MNTPSFAARFARHIVRSSQLFNLTTSSANVPHLTDLSITLYFLSEEVRDIDIRRQTRYRF